MSPVDAVHKSAKGAVRVPKWPRKTRLPALLRVFATVLLAAIPLLAADPLPEKALSVLKKNCLACHGAALKASGLDLRSRESTTAGGERGPALVPGFPDRSPLYSFAAHKTNPTMPPGAKISDTDLETLNLWITAGAPWPAAAPTPGQNEAKAALAAMENRPITDQERNFWSFRPITRPAIPNTGSPFGKTNPIDSFLAAKWQEHKLKPSPQADPRTLIRRAYLDITGLPPTPTQVEAFVNDKSPKAWENLVESLLASPHYGERWGRHWLDMVRFADSGGFEYDNDRPNVWRYRDYVVRAFNADKPIDQFIREQIAGDELDHPTTDSRLATGFLRLGVENNVKSEMTKLDELDDVVSTTSLAFLGMTIGCARCHNHKFDPIPQKDYYQIQAVFFSAKPVEFPLVPQSVIDEHQAANKTIDDLQAPFKKRRAALEKPHRDRLFEQKIKQLAPYMQLAWRTPADKRTEGQRLNARQIEKTLKIEDEEILALMSAAEKAEHQSQSDAIAKLDKQRPKPYASAMTIGDHGRDALPSYFLYRGSPDNKGSLMDAGILTVAGFDNLPHIAPPPGAQSTYRRRNFAEWVASPRNPLTARVFVNRIWQHHFGEGIVATPSNFGKTGTPPTHPELLDYLASEFLRNGWSTKAMHRLMMNSHAYRMSSDDTIGNRAIDATNRFLWRAPRQRLDAETLRDNMLAAAGTLDTIVGGPAVLPYIDPSLFQGSSKRTWNGVPDTDPSTWRRSLYVFNKRSIRYPLFESFDQPDMITSCARRNTSTTAPQALLLMNNAMVRLHAAHFAERLRKEAGEDPARQVERAFTLAFGRAPLKTELASSTAFITANTQGLVDFCHAIFNMNEFAYAP